MEAQYYLLYLLVRPFLFNKKGWTAVIAVAIILHIAAWEIWQRDVPIQPLSPFRYWLEWLAGAFIVYLLRKYKTLLEYWLVYLLVLITTVVCVSKGWWVFSSMNSSSTVFWLILLSSLLILVFLRFERLWTTPFLRWLPSCGAFSYSIYLVHFLFMDRIRVFIIPGIPSGWPRLCVSICSIILCLVFSYIFFLFCEKIFLDKAASIKTHQLPLEFKTTNAR